MQLADDRPGRQRHGGTERASGSQRSGAAAQPHPAHTGNYLLFDNAAPAQQQQVLPGATVHILVAKYRCDVGTDQGSDRVKVQLADGTDLAAFPRTAGMFRLASCRSQAGTPAGRDPGNFLQMSAFLAGQSSED